MVAVASTGAVGGDVMAGDPGILGALDERDPRRAGPYEFLGVLGNGGMARVFLGRSPEDRLVAVKVIYPNLAADHGFRVRLVREVSAARRVSSAFTSSVVNADLDGPQPWLATEYVAGPSLHEAIMNYGPLPVASVLALAAGLAGGLGAIHAAGVVHRDLKPSQVLLARKSPRITDFGISQALSYASLTESGIGFATPSFMSPEQGKGEVAGPPSDIFSLGSVLAYAATGRTPFRTGQAFEVFYRVVHGEPDTSDVPARLRPLITHCLTKDPGLRADVNQIMADAGPVRLEPGWLPEDFDKIFPRYEIGSFGIQQLASPAAAARPLGVRAAPRASNTAGHVFISYVREDADRVNGLQRALENAGISVWRDTSNLWPGEDWRSNIRQAIMRDAFVFIACFSRSSLSRMDSYQYEEIALAIDEMRRRAPENLWFIPVRFDDCEIPDREIGAGRTLTSIQSADLFGGSADGSLERLVAAVLRILGRRPGVTT
jgi:serine/threonine protein kinase